MRLAKRRRKTRPDMNMTPMIDIVFLLIIFFMTVTQVSEVNKERLELARLQGTQDQQPATVTINVTREGQYRVSGRTVSLVQLVGLIGQELDRLGGNRQRLNVVVRSDERGLSRATNDVMRALSRLGVVRVFNAVESSQ